MTEPTPHEEAAMRLATDAHAVRCALRLGRLVGRSDKQKISDVIVRLERTVSTLLAANQAQAEELKALRERANEAEQALAVCRQSLVDQAAARLDPTMPILTADLRKALRADAEAQYAMAETQAERIAAHGLSLICDWQDRAALLHQGDA